MSVIWEAYRNLFKQRPTRNYPYKEKEKIEPADRFRGRHLFNRDVCIGCTLCEKDCPAAAITIIVDEKGKRPIFLLDRCMFCGQCKETCPVRAIDFSKYFENAGFDRKEMVVR
jgi:formate hydrogenlyase subunit 6/NADH:ubiquinone oxidoreductase subunit I